MSKQVSFEVAASDAVNTLARAEGVTQTFLDQHVTPLITELMGDTKVSKTDVVDKDKVIKVKASIAARIVSSNQASRVAVSKLAKAWGVKAEHIDGDTLTSLLHLAKSKLEAKQAVGLLNPRFWDAVAEHCDSKRSWALRTLCKRISQEMTNMGYREKADNSKRKLSTTDNSADNKSKSKVVEGTVEVSKPEEAPAATKAAIIDLLERFQGSTEEIHELAESINDVIGRKWDESLKDEKPVAA